MPNLDATLLYDQTFTTRRTVSGPNPANVGTTVSVQDLGKAGVSHRSRSSVNTPGYRALKATGMLPVNNFSYTEWNRPFGFARGQRTYLSGGYTYSFDYEMRGATAPVDLSVLTNSQSELNSAMLRRARRSQFGGGQFIGELGQTLGLAQQTLSALTFLYRTLKRGDIDRFWDNLHHTYKVNNRARKKRAFMRQYIVDPTGAAANAWLLYRYGWTPFLSDMKSFWDTLGDRLDRSVYRSSFRVSRHRVERTLVRDARLASNQNLGFDIYGTISYSRSLSQRLTCTFQFSPPSILASFGLDNPAQIAWDLMPLTFVADWFLPIGEYLDAISSVNGSFVTGAYGIRQQNDVTAAGSRSSFSDLKNPNLFGSSKAVIVQRMPATAPVVSLRPRLALSTYQLVDAMSLLRGLLR